MKQALNYLLSIFGLFWNILPAQFRLGMLTLLLILESRAFSPKNGLKNLFQVEDKLNWIINERAMKFGEGQHPKHSLIRYHDYFISKIKDGETVVDIGCSRAEVSREIARARPKSKVIGIDIEARKIEDARRYENPKNLYLKIGDATKASSAEVCDVLIVSNVLEHIKDRNLFLRQLCVNARNKRILLRVPLFERDWKMPLRRKMGINYFSDSDHKIEHTLEEFLSEIEDAKIDIVEFHTLWGEIWAEGACEIT